MQRKRMNQKFLLTAIAALSLFAPYASHAQTNGMAELTGHLPLRRLCFLAQINHNISYVFSRFHMGKDHFFQFFVRRLVQEGSTVFLNQKYLPVR